MKTVHTMSTGKTTDSKTLHRLNYANKCTYMFAGVMRGLTVAIAFP